jgi:citrate lyase subunit beta/citryl-CoA lyase
MTIRPRRSVLYMPGSNARALDKARGLAADALIFDLEDAVAPAAKATARAQVRAALDAGGYRPRECVVRINALDTPWGEDDLAALAGAGADAILVPKVSAPAEVHAVATTLAGADDVTTPLWIMAETAAGILAIDAIAAAHPRLAAIVMGTSDLAQELRVQHTPGREGLLTSLNLAVLAARAHGLDVLDGVYLQLDDDAGFEASCRQGLALGFDGKTLIHPRQLDAANRVFAPDPERVAVAERIVEAWSEAENSGRAVVVVDGRLVEELHVREAQRLLALEREVANLDW